MTNYLMKKYALSKSGAVGMLQGIVSHTFTDIALMLPVGILYLLVSQLLPSAAVQGDAITVYSPMFYAIACAVVLVLLFILHYIQYNATYFSEKSVPLVCRIGMWTNWMDFCPRLALHLLWCRTKSIRIIRRMM